MQSKTIHQAAPSNHYGEAIDFKETLKASEALVSEAWREHKETPNLLDIRFLRRSSPTANSEHAKHLRMPRRSARGIDCQKTGHSFRIDSCMQTPFLNQGSPGWSGWYQTQNSFEIHPEVCCSNLTPWTVFAYTPKCVTLASPVAHKEILTQYRGEGSAPSNHVHPINCSAGSDQAAVFAGRLIWKASGSIGGYMRDGAPTVWSSLQF